MNRKPSRNEYINAIHKNDVDKLRNYFDNEGKDKAEESINYMHLLHEAAYADASPKIAELLLEYGADPNLSDLNGVRPIHEAARYASREFIEKLIEAGADPLLKENSVGNIPRYIAEENVRHPDVKDILPDPNYSLAMISQKVKSQDQEQLPSDVVAMIASYNSPKGKYGITANPKLLEKQIEATKCKKVIEEYETMKKNIKRANYKKIEEFEEKEEERERKEKQSNTGGRKKHTTRKLRKSKKNGSTKVLRHKTRRML